MVARAAVRMAVIIFDREWLQAAGKECQFERPLRCRSNNRVLVVTNAIGATQDYLQAFPHDPAGLVLSETRL